jgi:hypothetical protein
VASLALAKLCQSTSGHADANAVLGRTLEGFSPKSEMPETVEAASLVSQLAIDLPP